MFFFEIRCDDDTRLMNYLGEMCQKHTECVDYDQYEPVWVVIKKPPFYLVHITPKFHIPFRDDLEVPHVNLSNTQFFSVTKLTYFSFQHLWLKCIGGVEGVNTHPLHVFQNNEWKVYPNQKYLWCACILGAP